MSVYETKYRIDEADGSPLPGDLVFRMDIVDELGELEEPVVNGDGSVTVGAFLAKPGVYEYRQPDGSVVRELVRAETLRRDMEKLRNLTVTVNHPRGGKVTPENQKQVGVGNVGENVFQMEDGRLKSTLTIRDRAGLDAVQQRGFRQNSCGYFAEVRLDGGEHPEFGPYDREQVSRNYNHVALVERGRHGEGVYLRADDEDNNPGGLRMNPRIVQILGLLGITDRLDGEDAALEAIHSNFKVRLDEMEGEEEESEGSVSKVDYDELKKERDELQAKVDTMSKDMEEMKGKLDAFEKKMAEEEERADAAALEPVAKHYKVDTADKSAADIRKGIAEAFIGDLHLDSDEYINGIVDAAKAKMGDTKSSYTGHKVKDSDRQRREDSDDGSSKITNMGSLWARSTLGGE